MSRRGVAESEHFTKALIDIAARGLRTHCSDSETHHLWLSEIEAERGQAAALSRRCPALVECGDTATARGEKFATWAGIDHMQRPSAPKGESL